MLALALATAWLSLAADAGAFVAKATPSGAPVHWSQPSVRFEVDPALEAEIPGTTDALSAALGAWTQGAPELPALDATTAQATIAPANDGHNVVYYAKDGDPRAGSALAVTILSYDASSGAVVDSDIIINGKNHHFAVLPDGARAPSDAEPVATEGGGETHGNAYVFDIEHVVAHEVGHTLGLSDEPAVKSALMYPYTLPGDASSRAPAGDDVAGIESLYGSEGSRGAAASDSGAGQAGCGGAQIAPGRGAGSQGWPVAMVLLVGVALLVVRSRTTLDDPEHSGRGAVDRRTRDPRLRPR